MGNTQTRFNKYQKLNDDYQKLKLKYNHLEKKYHSLLHKQLNESVNNEFKDIANTLEIILKSSEYKMRSI